MKEPALYAGRLSWYPVLILAPALRWDRASGRGPTLSRVGSEAFPLLCTEYTTDQENWQRGMEQHGRGNVQSLACPNIRT